MTNLGSACYKNICVISFSDKYIWLRVFRKILLFTFKYSREIFIYAYCVQCSVLDTEEGGYCKERGKRRQDNYSSHKGLLSGGGGITYKHWKEGRVVGLLGWLCVIRNLQFPNQNLTVGIITANTSGSSNPLSDLLIPNIPAHITRHESAHARWILSKWTGSNRKHKEEGETSSKECKAPFFSSFSANLVCFLFWATLS